MELDAKYVHWLSAGGFFLSFGVLYLALNSGGWISTISFFIGGALVAWHWDEDKFLFINSRRAERHEQKP